MYCLIICILNILKQKNMGKQVCFYAMCALFLTFSINVQSQSHRNRPIAELQAGIGLIPTYFKDNSKAVTLPLSFQAAWRVKPRYSLGVIAGYSQTDFQMQAIGDALPVQLANTYQMAALRGAVHTRHDERWEAYGGIAIGIQQTQIDVISGDISTIKKHRRIPESATKFYYSGFVGGRYRLTPSVGVFGELGWGASLVTVGVSYRWSKPGKCGAK